MTFGCVQHSYEGGPVRPSMNIRRPTLIGRKMPPNKLMRVLRMEEKHRFVRSRRFSKKT